jgi:DNA topoisomerase I
MRKRVGKGFAYFADKTRVVDKDTLQWIKSLAIPPAWNEVRISKSRDAKVLARGRDDAGRLQAIYNPKFRAKQERAKYSRILDFASQLPRLRRQVERDLAKHKLTKDKIVACVVKLIDEAYFRVGNTEYARKHHSYGITTMRRKHVNVQGYTVTFNFTGKSGQHQVKQIKDRTLAHIIKQLDEMPGFEIFKYIDEDGDLRTISSSDINEYIRKYMGNEFTAKDFRTWGGTLLAVEQLAAEQNARRLADRRKAVNACIKQVARRLGNTPEVARSSYIDPQVFTHYMGGNDFSAIRQTISTMRPRKYLSPDERCALQVLQSLG